MIRDTLARMLLVAALGGMAASGCSPAPTYNPPTSVAAELPVLLPVESKLMKPEDTYAVATEIEPPARDPASRAPRLADVKLTYLAYGLGCVAARGENVPEKDKTNGDVVMDLDVKGPGLKVHEVRYPYEFAFFDKFRIAKPGRIEVTLTLRNEATKEVYERRRFRAEIDRVLHAEIVKEDLKPGAESLRVRVRAVADPAHFVDCCRVEALFIKLAAPGDETGKKIGHWKLKIDPQDNATFKLDLARGPAMTVPSKPEHYALRLRLVDRTKAAESLVERFTVP